MMGMEAVKLSCIKEKGMMTVDRCKTRIRKFQNFSLFCRFWLSQCWISNPSLVEKRKWD